MKAMKEYRFSNVDMEFGDARFEMSEVRGMRENEYAYTPDYGYALLHQHIYYEILFCAEGETVFATETQTKAIRKGEMLIVRPGIWHYSCRNGKCKLAVLTLFLNRGKGDAGYYEYFKKTLRDFSLRAIKISVSLRDKILKFDRAGKEDTFRERCMQKVEGYSLLAALFDELNGFKNEEPVIAQKDSELKTMLLFEELRSDTDISLAELSERMNYSKVHISRLIKQHYGVTLTEIRTQAKIGAVKRMLLEHPELSVKEIAAKARFQNMSTFYHHFEKQEGCTPTEYRIKHAKEEK